MSAPEFFSGNAERTLSLLWTRVKQRGDLPGFSKVVAAIVSAMRGDDDREFNMTNTVLSDPVLTQKVLRLANSAMYSVFGQNINTVSKAVILLGTESIGHLALGLKLVDGLSNLSDTSADTRSEMEKAVLSGHIAREIASAASTRDAEEAVVCSMLHSLGRMMTSFYLPELWQQLALRCQSGASDDSAALDVLGLKLDELGRAVAKKWGFPDNLTRSLRSIQPQPVDEPLEHADWMAALSTMSTTCAQAIYQDESEAGMPVATLELAGIADGFADMLGIESSALLSAVDAAQTALAQDAPFSATSPAARGAKRNALRMPGKPLNSALLLARGVADVRDAVSRASTAQLVTMTLETIFKGFGFHCAVSFVRNRKKAVYSARVGFGDQIQGLIPQLEFDDAYRPDVFHAALATDKIIFVENAQDQAFANKLPRWWRNHLHGSRSFLILPLTAHHDTVGFIYGDWHQTQPAARVESEEIVLLNELRQLLTGAFEQRC